MPEDVATSPRPTGALHRVTSGQGEMRLVWLHGWGQDHRAFAKLAGLFDRAATNRLFDLPGFGASPPLSPDAGTEDYADALARELEADGGGPAVLIGHSYGGRVAVQLAARRPELVSALVLIAGAGIPRDRSVAWKLRARSLRLLGRAARVCDRLFGTHLRDAYVRRFGSADYRTAGVLRTTLVKAVNENLTGVAARVRRPVLLIYGAEDTETPPQVGEKFAAALPQATLKLLPGYGHWDIQSRGAHQCQTLITRFLEALPGDGRD